jgi:hypothetical protein
MEINKLRIVIPFMSHTSLSAEFFQSLLQRRVYILEWEGINVRILSIETASIRRMKRHEVTPIPALRTPLSCIVAHVLGDLRQIVYNKFTSSHHATSPSPPSTVPTSAIAAHVRYSTIQLANSKPHRSLPLNPTVHYL